MSDLDIAERRKPQDGKIKFKKYGGKDIELRVATIPTAGGLEDVVMRILHSGDPLPLDKIGFSKLNYDRFVGLIVKPYGLVFVCGPTGSGKTTTLHSALGFINKPDIKIWTAEDPVEITQAGLRQVQTHHKIGFDFATAMRSFLRADPDVIMVGEMRDKETTHIGIEASLTGHLVFSTLHTNSAPESITRLLDMGMDPFNFADAILGIMAQRLLRTLCKKCKSPYNPSKEEYDELVREYGPKEFEKVKIPYSKDLTLHKPTGCPECNNTGYSGRMGIHELLMGTDTMKRLIQDKATMEEIRKQAIKDGMTTLKQDGIEKIFGGHTNLLQVRKVCIK
jgi:type II secretory ATPase GspE/PulE/Tfp pilus assembly ATPase PilB-like protein